MSSSEAENGAPSPPRRSRWRWVRRIAFALVVLLTLLAVAVWIAFEPFARDVALEEAARRGIRLVPGDVTVEWGKVTFWNSRVRLDGVHDLDLEVDWIEVRALGLRPTSVAARGVRGRARSVDVIGQVLAFGRLRGDGLLPATANAIELSIAAAPDVEPNLVVRGAEGAFRPGEPASLRGVTIAVTRPRLRAGPFDLALFARGASLEIGLGETLEGAPLRVAADFDARRLEVSLRRVPAAVAAGWLGRPTAPGQAPWPGDFALEAKGTAAWPADPRGDVEGRIEATLFGLVPPVPSEIAGIAFGSDTKVAASFRAGAGADAVSFDNLSVVVGALRLDGAGSIAPRGDSFDARATLRGPIPCADLVGSAAVSRLGLPLGSGLGALAQAGIAGNVDLRIEVRVDGDRLATPEIRPSASIHCRLRLFGG